MPNDAEVLEQIRAAFVRYERPQHFTNYTHCPECAEHDELLLSRDIDTLRVEDVGTPGWDPFCFVAPEGFGFFFPALARLALDEPSPTHGWYLGQLLFHLTYEGNSNRQLLTFAPDQRRAVVVLLRYIVERRQHLLDEWLYRDELAHALDLWSGGA